MKKSKILLAPLLFLVSITLFTFLEVGLRLDNLTNLISPALYSVSLVTIIFFPNLKKVFLSVSISLLLCMVIFYLANQIEFSNWIGSVGFGILVISIANYLPQLLKNGFIEKF